jgi:uncharacterized protein YecT (DUF1311 family)
MRAILSAIIAIQIGWAAPAAADTSPASDRPISETLTLFAQNSCAQLKDPAEQLFCGDPELNTLSARLNSAVRDRLDRLPNRSLAIAENVEWIRDRNSSCGVFGRQAIRSQDFDAIKACLLKETEERIAILIDPNFDCLATNSTAGLLICSDPSLANAKTELNSHVLALIAKLKGDEAKAAFAEYARWSRERDRKCGLADKDNVPLDELSSAEGCLAEYLSRKTAEIIAANGDPKRIFGRSRFSPEPNADAVDLCVAQIHSANTCEDFLSVNRVFQLDADLSEQEALVTAEVEMIVLAPFAVCSPIASGCTGTCWDLKAGKAEPPPGNKGSRDSFSVAYRLRVEKSFAFQKHDSGGWRCNPQALHPIEIGTALSGP